MATLQIIINKFEVGLLQHWFKVNMVFQIAYNFFIINTVITNCYDTIYWPIMLLKIQKKRLCNVDIEFFYAGMKQMSNSSYSPNFASGDFLHYTTSK